MSDHDSNMLVRRGPWLFEARGWSATKQWQWRVRNTQGWRKWLPVRWAWGSERLLAKAHADFVQGTDA